MNKEQYEAIMPIICNDLVQYISKRQNITLREALFKFYNSKLYELLEKEETKVWCFDKPTLYSLFEKGEKTGTIKLPDVGECEDVRVWKKKWLS